MVAGSSVRPKGQRLLGDAYSYYGCLTVLSSHAPGVKSLDILPMETVTARE